MLYCFQEKGTGALLLLGEGNWCTFVLKKRKLVLDCSRGERNWCSTGLRSMKLLLYWPQEKEICALLFLGEVNWCSTNLREENCCSTDLRRKTLVQYCSQEKDTGSLLFPGEGNWCTTVLRRRKLVLFCFQEKETSALLFSGEGIWCSTAHVFRRRGLVLYCIVLWRMEIVLHQVYWHFHNLRHKIDQMPQNRPDATFWQEHKIGITRSFFIQFWRSFVLNARLLKTNRMVTTTKLYFL